MINLNHMQEFVTLAETCSFTKTAALLFTAQPAISRHISAIEKEFGAPLFVRDTRSVQITAAGEKVYRCFRDFLDQYDHTLQDIRSLEQGISGQLIISSPYYWTEEFTEPILVRFQQLYPDCKVQILSCQPQEGFSDMLAGHSDLALSVRTPQDERQITQHIFAEEKLGVVMRADHPAASKPTARLQDFCSDPLILLGDGDPTNENAEYNKRLLSLYAERGIQPPAIYYTQQVDTIGLTIRQTGGICIASYCLRHMKRSYTTTVLLEDADFTLPLCYCYKSDNFNPAIPLFLRVCHECFSPKT